MPEHDPRYEIIIAWSERDDAYIARVPDLPGCMAHGPSYEEALANVKDAMALWMDTAREDGIPLPTPRTYPATA